MQLRRTPTRSRVADAWLRRTGDTRPSGGDPMFKEFLKSEGGRKVRAPGHENEVSINTLNSSDEPADKKRLQEEYAKWSGGDDDTTTTKGRGVGVIDSPQKLKAVQDELVEDAVNFGVPEATAREMVRGLVVGDDDSSVVLVERNLQKAIDKAVGDRQKADADAAEKAKADKAEADKAEAEAEAKDKAKKALKALQGTQDKLIADAVEAGVPEEKARALAKELKEGDGDDALDEVREALKPLVNRANRRTRREQAVQRSTNSEQAVAEARTKLDAAKKSKNKDDIAEAQANLDRAEDESYAAGLGARDAELDAVDEQMSDDEVASLEAAEAAQAARAIIDDGEERLAEARESGDPEAVAEIEESIRAAHEAFEKAEADRKRLEQSVAEKNLAKNKRLLELSKTEFDKSWERAEKNRGMLLFDAQGKSTRYDPSRNDKAYEFFMTLLGEQIRKRTLPSIDEHGGKDSFSPGAEPEGGGDAASGGGGNSGGKGKGKGKGDGAGTPSVKADPEAGDLMSKPTKSGAPRNSDGSSPQGGGIDDYGPSEFWKIYHPDGWVAHDSKNRSQRFTTMEQARAYAKTGSSRVASRYLLRNGR